ncbi:MAG: TIM barrel protein [Clostridia bacterium]|nr:TIM barrel protein [Clostridia bacterium]
MIRFGPSGNCEAFYEAGLKQTFQEPQWLHSLGLNAFEYSFGLGQFLTEKTALKIGEEAKKYDIEVSVHAPYYINFSNMSETSKENNHKFVFGSLKNLREMGGRHCVIHIGSQMKFTREEALNNIKINFMEVLKEKQNSEYSDLILCPEAMGKYKQIGTYQEMFEICSWDDCLIPTLDFGHINCVLQGALKTKSDFKQILQMGIDKLGFEKMKDLHIHFSKIMYGANGEIKHLTFEDEVYGPNFEPMLDAIYELKLEPVIISESAGTQAPDAKTMCEYFNKLVKQK